jgi:hypothetical protein
MLAVIQTLHLDDAYQTTPYPHPTETTPIILPPKIRVVEMTPVMMIMVMVVGREMKIWENLTMTHLMRMVLATNPMALTTLTMMCNTISQMQLPHWPEMYKIKEMDLIRTSENLILSTEQIQPNSEHSSFNCSSVSMTDLTFLLMNTERSTSQSCISKASHLPTLRIHSLNRICIILWLGVMTTTNSFWS